MVKKIIPFMAIAILASAGTVVSLHKLLREYGSTQISISPSGVQIISWGATIYQYSIRVKPIDSGGEKPTCFYLFIIDSVGWRTLYPLKDELSMSLDEIKERCREKLEGVKKAEITVSVMRRGQYIERTGEINLEWR